MTVADCSLHRIHEPANLTVEYHHVVPQAWQRFWRPAGAKVDRDELWDPRTVPICPTGHRNVHFYMVALMKQVAAAKNEDLDAAVRAAGLVYVRHKPTGSTALLALERFGERGGKLLDLIAGHQWGEA